MAIRTEAAEVGRPFLRSQSGAGDHRQGGGVRVLDQDMQVVRAARLMLTTWIGQVS